MHTLRSTFKFVLFVRTKQIRTCIQLDIDLGIGLLQAPTFVYVRTSVSFSTCTTSTRKSSQQAVRTACSTLQLRRSKIVGRLLSAIPLFAEVTSCVCLMCSNPLQQVPIVLYMTVVGLWTQQTQIEWYDDNSVILDNVFENLSACTYHMLPSPMGIFTCTTTYAFVQIKYLLPVKLEGK